MSLQGLLGDSLVGKEGATVPVTDVSKEGRIVGLYFSAHWCPPCRAFTPKLVEFYNNFKKTDRGDKLEMVFVSSDREQEAFDDYFKEMPWLALPYTDREKKNKLSKKFKVNGIPSLVFVDGRTGKVICKDGRSAVTADMDGKSFPWPEKALSEILSGTLMGKNDEELEMVEAIKDKVVGLYFSAHWCPPCRGFTPKLIETYKKVKEAGKNLEIIFVSWDRTEDDFDKYFKDMPWLTLPFEDDRIQDLNAKFEVDGIPNLVILDDKLKVINKAGRASVGEDPEGEKFPWNPDPVMELSGGTVQNLNEAACLIYMSKNDSELNDVMLSCGDIAKEYQAACEQDDQEQLFFFYEGPKTGELGQQVRQFAGIEDKATLILLNIPEQQKYILDKDNVTQEDIKEIVEKFKTNKLDFTPLK